MFDIFLEELVATDADETTEIAQSLARVATFLLGSSMILVAISFDDEVSSHLEFCCSESSTGFDELTFRF